MRREGAAEFADEQGLGIEHDAIGEEAVGEAVEGRQEEPAAELSGEGGDERVKVMFGHERDELIEAFEVGRAYPFRVGLEEGPDEQDAEMIGAESSDGVEVAADGVGIPVVPAEPPVVRWGVIDAESVAREVEGTGWIRRGDRAGEAAGGCEYRGGCGGGCREKAASVHLRFLLPKARVIPRVEDVHRRGGE